MRKRGSHHPKRKTTKKQKKKNLRERLRAAQEENLHKSIRSSVILIILSSLVFLYSIYSWGCVWWQKLYSLFFFWKSWTKFIYGWVINNIDVLLIEYICCYMFAVAFCFDSIYFYSLFRLITHLMILAKKKPQRAYLCGIYQSNTWS